MCFHSQRQGTSCHGKVTYRTIGECERSMRAQGRPGSTRHKKTVHPYRCRSCGGFHVSSMTRAEYEERAHYRYALG